MKIILPKQIMIIKTKETNSMVNMVWYAKKDCMLPFQSLQVYLEACMPFNFILHWPLEGVHTLDRELVANTCTTEMHHELETYTFTI